MALLTTRRTQFAVVMLMAGWVRKALRHLDDAMVFYMLPVGVTPGGCFSL